METQRIVYNDKVVRQFIWASIIFGIVMNVIFSMAATYLALKVGQGIETAIPISIAVGLLMMDAMNLGLNVMTLGGLTVAIGVLVDDAIIGVENVFRRLRLERSLPEGERLNTLDTDLKIFLSRDVQGDVGEDLIEKQNAVMRQ